MAERKTDEDVARALLAKQFGPDYLVDAWEAGDAVMWTELLKQAVAAGRAEGEQRGQARGRVLGDCEVALKSLPEDCLGEHPEQGWSFRDELLNNIADVLREVDDE